MAETLRLLEELEDNGFALLGRVLSAEDAGAARARLQAQLVDTLADVGDRVTEHEGHGGLFAKIHTRENRHDLCLTMTDANRALIQAVLAARPSVYRGALADGDGGGDGDAERAALVEFGAITSHPGAERQTIHSDVEFCAGARRVLTTFVALQDVTEDMGPTLLWPGTHGAYWCEFYKPRMLGPVDPYYAENEPCRAVLRAGEALLLDTRVMHAGGANASDRDRTLFHFSFETPRGSTPVGFTYNLHTSLRGQLSLGDLVPPPRARADEPGTEAEAEAASSNGVS